MDSGLAASRRPGMTELINHRLSHGRAESGLQKVEIAAFVGLLDVTGEHPAIAALEAMLGLLPAATSHGIGSDSQRPFAIVIVGGLMAALLMSIFLLPTLYVWMAGPDDVLPEANLAEEV